jgi:hypothetical protein
VDGFHVQRVTKNEMDLLLRTQVREPVPSEHALDANNEVFTEWRYGTKELVGIGP